jgi:3-oxoacyl-[acyl-carrier-protein] synthase II
LTRPEAPIHLQGRDDAQRVVVTGLGLITPLGNDVPTSWAAILAGRSGAGPITQFDCSQYKTRIAAEVKDFDPTLYMDRKDARRIDRCAQLAVVATQQALADASFDIAQHDPWRVGVLIGSGIGGIRTLLEQVEVLQERGPRRVSPFTIPGLMLNAPAAHVSIAMGARGPNLALATACATGSNALGEAAEIIRRGRADAMIAGGSETAIVKLAMAAFDNLGALSTRNEEPLRASRPFDALRDGFLMAEGAGVLLLERLDLARARGARIYAELAGYGSTADAFHITAPAEDGSGAAECMRLALKDAGVRHTDVDYINAHGTSTPQGDIAETQAIKSVFGSHARKLAISSTKAATAHMLGAAGGVEMAISAKAIQTQIAPPTINLDEPDPECDLDYIPHQPREMPIRGVISNSFGFGGHNACLVATQFNGLRGV